MVRSLKGWLPNDAYWSHRDYTKDELQEQCRARKLSIIGYKWELVERLETYGKNDKSEKRRICWKHVPPYPIDYANSSEAAENAIFQVIRVMDKTGREGSYLDKHFTLLTGKAARHTVSFTRDIDCSCQDYRYSTSSCVHIQYVLRYVLSCPEPFRWQFAFLSSELETMYRNSRAVYTLLCTDWKDRDPICALCFKTSVRNGNRTWCLTCGRAMHNDCVHAAQQARKPEKQEECWRCEDMTEWSLDKYSNKGKARQAGPAAAVATPAVFDLTGSTIQQSVEHAARNGDEQGSSSDQIANDGKRNNELSPTLPPRPPTLPPPPPPTLPPPPPPTLPPPPPPTPPPRPTSPTLATTHILPAPQKTEDRHSEPSLFPAHAHSTVPTASTPSVDAGVEQIHGESHSSSSPSAQVDGVVSRTLEISDGSTAAGEVSGVTEDASGIIEAQDTTSTPAGETDPAPNREPASPHTPVPSGSKTDIENGEPIKLARDFKRLAKESDRIRKQAGQEISDIKKKRRKEIKNVKLRSKRELKRLKKKMKRLENEVKGLARPDAESVVG